MMHIMRLLILFLLVLFGAYTEYQAERTVKKIREAEKRQMQHKKEMDSTNAGFTREPIYRELARPPVERLTPEVPVTPEEAEETISIHKTVEKQ